jgi:hypothetical protein
MNEFKDKFSYNFKTVSTGEGRNVQEMRALQLQEK